MTFTSFLNNVLALAVILVFLKSFPFIFDAVTNACAIFALMEIFSIARKLLKKHFFSRTLSSRNKAVLITGCDSGIGHLLAQRLDKLGYHVFAACLFPLNEGAQDLKDRTSPKLQILGLDVTDQQSVLNALEFVKKNLKDDEVLWAVVNNAGIGQGGEIEWIPMEQFVKTLDTNTLGTVRVTKAFLALLRKSKGRVVNNTSLCGRLTNPGYVPYCMSKCAAVSFTTGLRMEMAKWGVKAISVEAFFFTTPLTRTEENTKLIEKTFDEAPDDIKEAYGKDYLNAFKQSCRNLLERKSPHVDEFLECFVDAITAEEPEPDYFPCYFPHKVILKLSRLLPQPFLESIQKTQMAYSVKPAGLCNNKHSA